MIRYNDFTERFFDADGNIVHPREIIERLASLRQERDDLKKRVDELEDTIELGVIEFHTPKNSTLQDKFYEVVEDLRLSGSIVDVWLMDIATTLKRHGYTMTIRRNNIEESPNEV